VLALPRRGAGRTVEGTRAWTDVHPLYLAVVGCGVAADLGTKTYAKERTPAGEVIELDWHHASAARIAATVVVAVLLTALMPALVRLFDRWFGHLHSWPPLVAGALVAAGSVANALSLAIWWNHVPNITDMPLAGGSLAFNLADCEIALGAIALIVLVLAAVARDGGSATHPGSTT
jgi:lipoprotein signal peptidase